MSQVCADTECYGLHLDIKDTGKMYDNVQYEVRNVYYQMDDIRQQLMKFNDSELSGAAWSALKTHFDEYRFVIFGYETAMRQFMNQISKFDSAASSGIAGDTCLDEEVALLLCAAVSLSDFHGLLGVTQWHSLQLRIVAQGGTGVRA